ncbi:MAG TPA: HslU--HslV peptidase ATPase subunit, partial [Alcanivorax sp.]|nr:HslU--HslV peptidase ATPase subunit [Alcanivorax sp.]
VMEKLLEEISYDADDLATQYHDKPLVLDAEAVDRYLGELASDEDLSRYIL